MSTDLNRLFGEARNLALLMEHGHLKGNIRTELMRILEEGDKYEEEFEETLLPYLREKFPLNQVAMTAKATIFLDRYYDSSLRYWITSLWMSFFCEKDMKRVFESELPSPCHLQLIGGTYEAIDALRKLESGNELNRKTIVSIDSASKYSDGDLASFINTEMREIAYKTKISKWRFVVKPSSKFGIVSMDDELEYRLQVLIDRCQEPFWKTGGSNSHKYVQFEL